MEEWRRYFQRGKEHLSKHNPAAALKDFQMAVQGCPSSDMKNLSKVLFYTGITLKKLGIPNGALKSWVVAQKLNKTGYGAKMIKRFINEYGMNKQENSYLDDWSAFHAIQLKLFFQLLCLIFEIHQMILNDSFPVPFSRLLIDFRLFYLIFELVDQ